MSRSGRSVQVPVRKCLAEPAGHFFFVRRNSVAGLAKRFLFWMGHDGGSSVCRLCEDHCSRDSGRGRIGGIGGCFQVGRDGRAVFIVTVRTLYRSVRDVVVAGGHFRGVSGRRFFGDCMARARSFNVCFPTMSCFSGRYGVFPFPAVSGLYHRFMAVPVSVAGFFPANRVPGRVPRRSGFRNGRAA